MRKGNATCHFRCGGDNERTCGGYDVISLYDYDDNIQSPTSPTASPTTMSPYDEMPPIDYDFVGCYKDMADPNRTFSGDYLTHQDVMSAAVRVVGAICIH